jgi:hypothetical protein
MPALIPLDLLAALVRAGGVDARALAGVDPASFCDLAETHGVLPLIAERLTPDVPAVLRARVERQAAAHVATDLLREDELRRVVTAFDACGVQALLFKGSHLAYRYYERPDLRVRTDTDVLVHEEDRGRAEAALVRLGYTFTRSMAGDLVMPQRTYVKQQLGVVSHAVDLHWRVANPQAFGGMLTFDELWSDAERVPALGPMAWGPSAVHALLIACVHRVAHHADSDCLVWLYDIHLVGGRLQPREWMAFVELAADRGVAGICRVSLERAHARFPMSIPGNVLPRLEHLARVRGERTNMYLGARRRIAAVLDDLRLLPSWAARLRLLREHVFPPPLYMREVYAPSSGAPLPVLYVQRVARGARKWLARP